MKSFKIKKASVGNNFLQINFDILGSVAGGLKLCGLKLFLYLAANKDGFDWTLNPSVYATWLGLDYTNPSEARAVRKMIADGINELIEKNILVKIDEEKYEFLEQKVPEK